MTALCGGGASQALPGTPGIVYFTDAAVEAFIAALGLGELAPIVAPIIAGLFSINIATYCATDPPPDPGLTAADVLDAIAVPPSATSLGSQQKILQWFGHRYWWQLCECSGGVVTPAPPAPSNPGPVGPNPGLPDGTGNSPCWDQDLKSITIPQNAGQTQAAVELTAQLLPALAPTLAVQAGTTFATTLTAQTVPTNFLRGTFTIAPIQEPGAGNEVFAQIEFYSSTGSPVAGYTLQIATSGTSILTVGIPGIPTNAVYWAAFSYVTFAPFTYELTFDFFCTGQGPNQLQVPCCPPDPLLSNKLDLILQYILALQSQTVVTKWKDGAVHSGLSGSGSFVFTGKPLGIRFDVTTPPQNPEIIPGHPDFYWNMGYVTPISLSTPLRGQRLVFLSEDFVLPVYADSMGYTLLGGTICNATELLADTAP